jgi:hypothetical protein
MTEGTVKCTAMSVSATDTRSHKHRHQNIHVHTEMRPAPSLLTPVRTDGSSSLAGSVPAAKAASLSLCFTNMDLSKACSWA